MIIVASVNATIAQSVEHFIRNEKVASSSLACGSGIFRKPPRHMLRGLFFVRSLRGLSENRRIIKDKRFSAPLDLSLSDSCTVPVRQRRLRCLPGGPKAVL